MVQLLPNPAFSPSGTPIHEASDAWKNLTPVTTPGADEHGAQGMSREEHAQLVKELQMKRAMKAPRRGWSMTEYQAEQVQELPPPSSGYHSGYQSGSGATYRQLERQPPIPENDPLPPSSTATPTPGSPASQLQLPSSQLPRRPKLPPPRRSYSVTDHEPILQPGQPRPSARLTILDLPSELHYSLLDFLDPIDSVCFGLAHSRFYPLHRRKYRTVPLSSRYSGPNDMEWAWRGAGPLVHPGGSSSSNQAASSKRMVSAEAAAAADKALAELRVKGQVYCRKCGVNRCELRRHLHSWMGPGREYCEIKEVFGRPAGPEAKPYCFMSSPKNPHRCGRHGGRRTA